MGQWECCGVGEASVTGWDNNGGRCAIALLGRWQHCLGMRVVVGMDWQALLCQGRRTTASGLKGMLQSTYCWMGRVEKSWGEGGHDICHGGRRRTTMGSSPNDGGTATYAAIPPSPPTEMPTTMRGRLHDLEADGPPPPPSWLVCGFSLQERRNKKDK